MDASTTMAGIPAAVRKDYKRLKFFSERICKPYKIGYIHDNTTGGCGDRDECTGGYWDVTLCNGEQPLCEEAHVATGNKYKQQDLEV